MAIVNEEYQIPGNFIVLCNAGHPNEHTRGNSQANCAGAKNKPSITMFTYCGLLPFFLSQWSYISCARIHGPWISD